MDRPSGNVGDMPPALGEQASSANAYLSLVRKRSRLTKILFWMVVVIPTCFAVLFYAGLAAPRYVSEARFIVRSVSSPQVTGLDVLFRTIGIAKTADDAYIIEKYLLSRDALEDLAAESVNVEDIFSRPEADFFSRYPRFWKRASQEALYDYYVSKVTVTEDAVKGIIRLSVVAFRPEDANEMARALLVLAEKMVNKINRRAQDDTIEAARREVSRAEAHVLDVQSQLTAYRNTQLIVDPAKSASGMLETIGKLTAEKMAVMAQLTQMQRTAPQNPAIGPLKARVAALDQSISVQQAQLAGDDSALAGKLEHYEQFILKRDLADKLLTGSLQSLDDAMREARRQHIYVEQVVRPNLPDYSTEPERIRSILTVFVLGMALFSVGWLLMVGAGEHLR